MLEPHVQYHLIYPDYEQTRLKPTNLRYRIYMSIFSDALFLLEDTFCCTETKVFISIT